jgi:hypothetical protein
MISETIGWNHRRVIQLPLDLHSIHIHLRPNYAPLTLIFAVSISFILYFQHPSTKTCGSEVAHILPFALGKFDEKKNSRQ